MSAKLISWAGRLTSPAIDLLTIFVYSFFIKELVRIYAGQKIWNILIILGAYYLMCGAILVSKQLEKNPDFIWQSSDKEGDEPNSRKISREEGEIEKARDDQPGCVTVLSWFFSVFVIAMIIMTSGIFERGNETGAQLEGFIFQKTFGIMLMLVIVVSILLLFPLLSIKRSRSRIKYGTRSHLVLKTVSVFAVNVMILITVAFWEWQLAGSDPMDVSFTARLLIFLLAYVVFLLFYAPPRLVLLSLEPSRWATVGYLIFLGWTVWNYMN